MSDVPLASYEDPRWKPANKNIVGNRGFTGNLATLSTTTGVAQTDFVISAKDCFAPSDPPIKVQYAVLAPGAPQGLYEDGYPALWSPLPTDLGFQILMKRAGTWGNYFTLTLVNPGRPGALDIVRPAAKDIVITLGYAVGAITTTPAQLIAAINNTPELAEYMVAFASSAGPATLPAFSKKSFTGGSDVPGLVLVSLVNTAGTSSATGLGVMNLLNGSRYVSAKPAASNTTNAGLVPAVAAMTLTAGTANQGEIADANLTRRSAATLRRRAGQPIGKETNKTLQLRDTRLGAPRSYQRVSKQDRAIVNASPLSLQTDQLAAHNLG